MTNVASPTWDDTGIFFVYQSYAIRKYLWIEFIIISVQKVFQSFGLGHKKKTLRWCDRNDDKRADSIWLWTFAQCGVGWFAFPFPFDLETQTDDDEPIGMNHVVSLWSPFPSDVVGELVYLWVFHLHFKMLLWLILIGPFSLLTLAAVTACHSPLCTASLAAVPCLLLLP